MRLTPLVFVSSLTVSAALAAAACSDGGSTPSYGAPVPLGSTGPAPTAGMDGGPVTTPPGDGGKTPIPFVADNPYTYVAKVKNVLIGLPPTDDEMKSVVAAADPKSELQALIKTWMNLVDPNDPEGSTYYVEKMRAFFMQATQQTQISITDFTDQSNPAVLDINQNAKLLVQNSIESFARTMIAELVQGGQPTTNVATTTTFQLTTALAEMYAWLDTYQVNDDGTVNDGFVRAYPDATLTAESAQVALADSVNPANAATFLHFTDPDVVAGGPYSQARNLPAGCAIDPMPIPTSALAIHHLLYGGIRSHKMGGVVCPQFGGTLSATVIGNPASGGAKDFSDWHSVTIRQPKAGEKTTAFFDIPALRTASTMVLDLPRAGFFTTPAFFANWQTNTSNTMRVTMNQTLIVALGAMYDGADSTATPLGDAGVAPGLDSMHDQGVCFTCHRLLDPGRSLLASTYSWNYHAQDTAALAAQPGIFAFQGVTAYPSTVYDLAKTLSTHPLFAQAWVQKLCYYANSQACETTDPEFTRVVGDFASASYSWNDLVVDILSSPLTTNAVATQTTTDQGAVVAVSRLGHFCAALDFRLGFADICGLLPTTTPPAKAIVSVAGGLPSDGYGRGATAPVLPNAPSLFFRAGTENICEAVAQLVIDPKTTLPGAKSWSSSSPSSVSAAETDFVQLLMGIVPSDPRYGQALSLIQAQYTAALAATDPLTDASDFTPTSALQSAFVAACLAPSAVTIGL